MLAISAERAAELSTKIAFVVPPASAIALRFAWLAASETAKPIT